jgi:hypothetical protein
VLKEPSTQSPVEAVVEGIRELEERLGIRGAQIGYSRRAAMDNGVRETDGENDWETPLIYTAKHSSARAPRQERVNVRRGAPQ